MSWRLEFYRRVGQPWLTLESVDAVLGTGGEFIREPGPGEPFDASEPAEAPGEVVYRFADIDAGIEFEYGYLVVPVDEDSGRADFPFEAMPFELRIPFFQGEAAALRAIESGSKVADALDLLVLDPQVEQETPGRPDEEALLRSYTLYNREVEETLEFMKRRGRVMAKGVLVILAVAVLWMALAVLSRG